MQPFNGFPSRPSQLRVPSTFFSELLPSIDHLAELKVTLYCFWAVNRQDGKYRYVRLSEALSDELLMAGLESEVALRDGFERAVARGTLLHVELDFYGQAEQLYFFNSPIGRQAVEAIKEGRWIPDGMQRPIHLIIERPNIFVIYENNIGAITPMIADELQAAEDDYPAEWIVDAIEIAVKANKRSWRYIQSILNRWTTEGKDVITNHEATQRPASQFGDKKGDYSDFFS